MESDRWRRRSAAHVVEIASRLAARLPPETNRAAGRLAGRCATRIWPAERRRTIRNLARVTAVIDGAVLGRMVRLTAERLGENAFDVLRAHATGEAPRIETDGLSVLDAALAEGNGAVIASAHAGPWELLAPALAHAGYRAALVVRHARNPALAPPLRRFRERGGVRLFARGAPMGDLVAWLRAGGVIGIVIDQQSRGVRSTDATFCGCPARVPVGPAVLAARAGAPLLVATVRRLPHERGALRATFVRAPEIPRTACGRADVAAATRALARLLDRQLRRDPAQWVWFHERFAPTASR